MDFKNRVALVDAATSATTEYNFQASPGCKSYADETYQDMLHSPILRDELSRLLKYPKQLPPLNQLPDVKANSIQVLMVKPFTSPVEVVLWAADLNLQVRMAAVVGGADLHGNEKAQQVLKDKLLRASIPDAKRQGFGRLLDISGLPDISSLISSQKLPFNEVLAIRESKEAIEFRKWLANAEPKDARDLERRYVQSLSKIPSISSLPAKIIRFALTTTLGIVGPIVGGAVSFADSFFAERWLGGYQPKLFFDDLKKKLK